MSSRRVHYVGNAHVTRSACGRMVLTWREDSLRWTTDRAAVTCQTCRHIIDTVTREVVA